MSEREPNEVEKLRMRVAALERQLASCGPDSIDDIDLHEFAWHLAEMAGREESTDADYCDALLEAVREIEAREAKEAP